MGLMGLWTEPELTCGFVAASAPVIPRFFKHTRNQTPFRQIGDAFRRVFGAKGETGETQPTHGEVQRVRVPPRKFISDIDFHDLVIKTDGTETTMGSEERGGLEEIHDGREMLVREV
jgi:hypothetical protein